MNITTDINPYAYYYAIQSNFLSNRPIKLPEIKKHLVNKITRCENSANVDKYA
jgi:hypothetical protein